MGPDGLDGQLRAVEICRGSLGGFGKSTEGFGKVWRANFRGLEGQLKGLAW